MLGAIRRRDLIVHPVATIHCFGWRVFARAMMAGGSRTFLSVVAETSFASPLAIPVPTLVGRCVELELRAMRLYGALARRFPRPVAARDFFLGLAAQEREHGELLDLCRAAAEREGWDDDEIAPWSKSVPGVERQFGEVESRAAAVTSVAEALRLAIELESTELNHAYRAIVAASDSDFVRHLAVFRAAGEQHIDYLCDGVPRLEPALAGRCERLRRSYARAGGGHQ